MTQERMDVSGFSDNPSDYRKWAEANYHARVQAENELSGYKAAEPILKDTEASLYEIIALFRQGQYAGVEAQIEYYLKRRKAWDSRFASDPGGAILL